MLGTPTRRLMKNEYMDICRELVIAGVDLFYSTDHFFHPFLLKLFLTKDSIYWNKMIFENTSSHSNVS